MKRGDLVRMERPADAKEDRYTGRDFEVMDVVKGKDGPAVVVRDDAGTYRFREASLVKVPGHENEAKAMSFALLNEGSGLVLECRHLLRAAWHAAGMARRSLGNEVRTLGNEVRKRS